MSELETLLKASIQMEQLRQAVKAYNNLAEQVMETLKPTANCSPVVAMAMQVEYEIWEAAKAAGERALQSLTTPVEPIPMLTCLACKDPSPGLIDGFCISCDEAFTMSMRCGLQARIEHEPSNGVLQMKRRIQ